MKVYGRRLYQLALLVMVAALVTNCGLLWDGPERDTAGRGNFKLTLWVSRGRISVGQPVKIRFTVENTGDQIEVVQLEKGPVMDISVRFGAGSLRTTLYWSDGREITPEMRRLALAPGESKTIEMIWVPDERATNESVSVDAILHGEYMSMSGQANVTICVGTCYLGH